MCVPTGVAAHNVNGQTLHSTFCLPVQKSKAEYQELSSSTLKRLRDKKRDILVLVIDEISMVSSEVFLAIHRRLCAIKNNDNPFGNMNIILVGDFVQLRPLHGSYAFSLEDLWNLFTPFFLRENVRQANDLTYVNLLNRAPVGALNAADIQILQELLLYLQILFLRSFTFSPL